MNRILRYEIPVDDAWHTISGCGAPLHVGCRNADIVEFWAWELQPPDRSVREFKVIGTGHLADSDSWYAGTALAPGGHLVWHLMVRTPLTHHDTLA